MASFVTSAAAFSHGRQQLTMKTAVYDLKRRQKFNKILGEVRANPTKEVIDRTLLSTGTSDLIEQCNWKLRKSMIRKVNNMAEEFGAEVGEGFGVPPTHEEWVAQKMEASVGYRAAKLAKLEAAIAAQKEQQEKKAARKARRAAARAGQASKSKAAEPEPAAAEPAAEAPKPAGGEVTVAMIKDLRLATGAGMMDCKKALVENGGDAEAATEFLRKKGLAKADKKASRVAAEGKIFTATKDDKTIMVEVNCETDFVAKDGSFMEFANSVATAALDIGEGDVESLKNVAVDGSTIEENRQALVARIGENIQVRRFIGRGGNDNTVGSYIHLDRIGVMVEIEGGTEQLAVDIAMHVAAMNPPYAVPEEVEADVLEKEKGILRAQALESGKPPEIVEKMIEGRIRKYLEEICLVSQTYVKTGDKTVGKLLEENGAKMVGFSRIAVGEGIEKKEDNFAEEVAQMAAGGK